MTSEVSRSSTSTWRQIPRGVWALGAVSLLMDVSSEMVHSLLPVFLVTVVGASTVVVGLIEGLGEATAAVAKVFSGALSDRLGKRKLLAGIGYALGALTKPMFPLATTAGEVMAARFIDRIGKGIRGAPRLSLPVTVPTDPRSARLHNPDQFRRADRSRLVAKMGVKIGRRSGVILARRLTTCVHRSLASLNCRLIKLDD